MSGLKEKKEKKNPFLKDPFKLMKNLRGKVKGGKPAADDPQQPPTEQKSPLLQKNLSSDTMPVQDALVQRPFGVPPPRHGDMELQSPSEPVPLVIMMSNGKTVDHPGTVKPPGTGEFSTSPSTSPWSPSSSVYHGGPYPRPADRRPGYEASPYPSPWTQYEQHEPQRPVESAQQTATYDSLLKEAQTLRRDLEKEYSQNRGSKEEVAQKINLTKIEIADVQKNKPSAEMYDEIIVTLSQELTDLEKKVKEIEARMYPLDRAISDLRDVEDFITGRELDSDGAAMLFEEIMKKMLDDVNLSGHVLSGEAVSLGHMPRNVLDEMKGKVLTGALKKSDPTASGFETDAGNWVSFENEFGTREKLTSTEEYDSNYRKKRNKANFQRASRKLSNITEFTHSRMKNPARTEAFKFSAFDRADAFRHVDYTPSPEPGRKEDIVRLSPALSVASDQKSTEPVLEQMDQDMWMGLNHGTGTTPPPSDVPESVRSSKSVADLQGLDQYPGLSAEGSSAEKSGQNKGQSQFTSLDTAPSTESLTEKKFSSSSSGEGKPPLAVRKPVRSSEAQTVPPKAVATEIMEEEDTALQKEPEKPKKKESPVVEEKTDENETGGMAQELANVQLKKPTEKPQEPPPVAPDMDSADFALLAASIMADPVSGTKAEGGVKLDLNIDEPPPEPKKPETKPPPPPPKKGAPPPPPPPKKRTGAPPPPPGKKAGGKTGGPPPPPKGGKKAVDGLQRAPDVIAMFQEMRKALLGNAAKGSGGPKKIGGGGSADPGALMEELSKNSKYAAQVQADVVNYGPLIEDLIKEVSGFIASDMKEVVEFVKRVDAFLAELADETAVLKQFDWPARYYTMLEAKGLYEELEKMKKTFKPWQRTAKTPAEELKMIQKFMDKSKNRIDVILRTKDADEKKFKENKIPWNAKVYTEVKIASLSVLVEYMEIVSAEVDNVMKAAPTDPSPQRKKAIEKSAINFAFKAHQFAGGFTDACNAKFAEIATKTRELKSEAASAAS